MVALNTKKIKYKLIIAILLLIVNQCIAKIDTVAVFSIAMQKNIKAVVITPKKYKPRGKAYPTVYLLHGYSDVYYKWIKRVPELEAYSTLYEIIIVCPDGGFSSWYVDSPIDSSFKYETFMAKELVTFIDGRYNTINNRKGRAITGLSMGGHGGLYLGWQNATVYGACGSMSGGVNLAYSKNKFDVAKRIGSMEQYPENWKKYSVLHIVENKPADSLAIIIDCGVNDFFFNDNKALHAKLLSLQVPHDYIERPGKHEWAYWQNAIRYQLLYFYQYFLHQSN